MNQEFKIGKDYIGIGVFALILNNERQILLARSVRTDKTSAEYEKWWKMPGGTVEFGETIEEALIREIKEETDLEIKINQFLGYDDYIKNNKHWIALNFLVYSESTNFKNNEPHKHPDMRWFLKNEIPENMSPFCRKYLNKLGYFN